METDWCGLKEQILQLYQTNPLRKVMRLIQEKHGFKASERTWRTRLREWEFKKNSPAFRRNRPRPCGGHAIRKLKRRSANIDAPRPSAESPPRVAEASASGGALASGSGSGASNAQSVDLIPLVLQLLGRNNNNGEVRQALTNNGAKEVKIVLSSGVSLRVSIVEASPGAVDAISSINNSLPNTMEHLHSCCPCRHPVLNTNDIDAAAIDAAGGSNMPQSQQIPIESYPMLGGSAAGAYSPLNMEMDVTNNGASLWNLIPNGEGQQLNAEYAQGYQDWPALGGCL